MLRRRLDRAIPAALALGVALGGANRAHGQGPTPASGSGSGTGTGTSAGSFGSTGTGTESSTGLGTTGTGLESSSSTRQSFTRPGIGQPGTSRGSGGGASIVNPDITGASRGTSVSDLLSDPIPGGPSDWNSERDKLFAEARSTLDPGERALALVRIARTAIFSTKFADAETALREASAAALLEPTELIRDQRVIAIVTTMTNLAEELTRPEIVPEVPDGVALTPVSRMSQFTKAARVWRQSGVLASRITNPTYRAQTLYRAVESESFGAQSIANEPAPMSLAGPSPGEVPQPLGGDGGQWPPAEVIALTDDLFREAAQNAARIERPVWRDRSYVTIAVNASAARQYQRGLSIARLIPQPEVRTDALVRIAIAQATHNFPNDATSTYGEAAAAVASIPLTGPRTILAGVLIDSLISVGRFDDARACIVLYPEESRRLVALEAVALAMGERGAAASARSWIDREAPVQYRSTLHRRVSDGIIASVERNRSRDLTRGR